LSRSGCADAFGGFDANLSSYHSPLKAYPKTEILEGAMPQRRAFQNFGFWFSDRH
jgi:hypothetical protein